MFCIVNFQMEMLEMNLFLFFVSWEKKGEKYGKITIHFNQMQTLGLVYIFQNTLDSDASTQILWKCTKQNHRSTKEIISHIHMVGIRGFFWWCSYVRISIACMYSTQAHAVYCIYMCCAVFCCTHMLYLYFVYTFAFTHIHKRVLKHTYTRCIYKYIYWHLCGSGAYVATQIRATNHFFLYTTYHNKTSIAFILLH